MRIEPEVLNDFVWKFVRDGWQVVTIFAHFAHLLLTKEDQNIHAIGDRSNAIVIDALEAAMKETGLSGHETRPRIEHAQIILPVDAKRLAQIGGKC